MSESPDVTAILDLAAAGDRAAVDRLFPLVYDELRRLAGAALGRERADHTLQATALVHEVYVRMIDQQRVRWENKAHFMAIAAGAIRRILVDHARRKRSKKRGGDAHHVDLDDVATIAGDTGTPELVELDRVLELFARDHPEKARIVELRFFGGLTHVEIARVLSVSERTVERHWQFAKAWLFRELSVESEE